MAIPRTPTTMPTARPIVSPLPEDWGTAGVVVLEAVSAVTGDEDVGAVVLEVDAVVDAAMPMVVKTEGDSKIGPH